MRNRGAGSVVDPHHLDEDPDSTHHPEADPEADLDYIFYLIHWLRGTYIPA
jgi:hypothetical protein